MKTINERVEELMQYHNLNSNTLGRKLNVTGSSVLYILNGKTKTITDVMIRQIMQQFPDISIRWLVLGEGEMLDEVIEKTDKIKQQVAEHLAVFHKIYDKRFEELEEKIRGLTKTPSD